MSEERGSLEDQIDAVLNGDITPELEKQLQEDREFAALVAEARQLKRTLKQRLFRWDCPSTQQIGEYQLGLLPSNDKAQIDTHLVHCIHCQRELADLRVFIDEPVIQEVPKPSPLRIPSLKDLIAQLLPPLPQAGLALRGTTSRPQMYEADGNTIFIETESTADGTIVRGQLVAQEPDFWQDALLEVYHDAQLLFVVPVDEDDTFQFKLQEITAITLRFLLKNKQVIRVVNLFHDNNNPSEDA